MFESFIEALPEKVRSTDDFHEHGTRFRKKSNALKCRYVEINQFYKKHIVLDIDKPGSAYWWDEKNIPPPTIITINPKNAHCHYLYELKTPVYYTEGARRAPQKYFENTDSALTNALSADLNYVGKFTKNPLHPSWRVIKHNATYDLEDFAEYIDLQKHKKKQKLESSIEGRNSTLFDNLRFWAYQEVKQHGSYTTFQDAVDKQAQSINMMFVDYLKGILPAKEVLSTARSVGAWTWKHRFSIGNGTKNRGILNLPDEMSLAEKQSKGAEYSHIVRTEKIDDKIKQAIHQCKSHGLNLTSGNLEKYGLSRSTFSKHKETVQNWIRLLTT